MKRSQWFVLGIGLILLGFFIGVLSNMNNCSDMQSNYSEMILEASASNLDTEFIQLLSASSDAWTISCLDMKIYLSIIYTIFFTWGVLFIICGFLERKKH